MGQLEFIILFAIVLGPVIYQLYKHSDKDE
jgi:hypothetical protein